jgi:hypothetical protein
MLIPMMILNGVRPAIRTLEKASERLRDATKFSKMSKTKEALVTVIISVEGDPEPKVAMMTKDEAAAIFKVPAVRDGIELVETITRVDRVKKSVGLG